MLIYILSRGPQLYSTSRIYQAAIRQKHTVRIIDHMECDLLIEGGILKVLYQNKILIKPDVVIPRIGSSATAYGTTVVRHFEEMGVCVLNSAMSIFSSRDKFRSLQILVRNAIPIPTSYFSFDLHHAEKIIQYKLGYPVIVKVIEGTQGNGVYLVHGEQEATQLFDSFATSRTKVILQEFIKEFKWKDIRVFVVGDKVVASMLRAANAGEFRSNLHRGGVGELVELSEEEETIALKSAKVLGLGIAGVDILRSKNGPLIIEVNSSPGLEGIEGVTRVKIAESIVDFAVEKFVSHQE